MPYWSWVQCLSCQHQRPPRSHHCPLCKACILKRDHHCFFSGVCIAANNQRFFLAFLFWTVPLTIIGVVHILPHAYYTVLPEHDANLYHLLIPPYTLILAIFGYSSYAIPLYSAILCSLIFFLIFGITHFSGWVYKLVSNRTGFEQENGIKLTDTRPVNERLKAALGNRWWIGILIPCNHSSMKPSEDSILWPSIKP